MSLAKTQRSPRAENSASSVVCHPSSLLCALGVLARAGFWLRPKAALGSSCSSWLSSSASPRHGAARKALASCLRRNDNRCAGHSLPSWVCGPVAVARLVSVACGVLGRWRRSTAPFDETSRATPGRRGVHIGVSVARIGGWRKSIDAGGGGGFDGRP